MAACIVSFLDTQGFRHTVEVQAESRFEAGVPANRAFKQCNCPPGFVSEIEVEIRKPGQAHCYSEAHSGMVRARGQIAQGIGDEGTIAVTPLADRLLCCHHNSGQDRIQRHTLSPRGTRNR